MRPPLPTQPSMLSEPDCVTDPDSWCGTVFHWTGNEWLAMYSDLLIAKPLHILLILIGAYLLRWAVHRMITRFMQGNGDQPPKLLQPLRERKAGTLSADLLSERRLQRTRAATEAGSSWAARPRAARSTCASPITGRSGASRRSTSRRCSTDSTAVSRQRSWRATR